MNRSLERLAELHPGVNKPYEPYCGVAALFNGDLHTIDPNYAPRGDWEVISAYQIKRVMVISPQSIAITEYYKTLDESDPANQPTDDETITQPPIHTIMKDNDE